MKTLLSTVMPAQSFILIVIVCAGRKTPRNWPFRLQRLIAAVGQISSSRLYTYIRDEIKPNVGLQSSPSVAESSSQGTLPYVSYYGYLLRTGTQGSNCPKISWS